MITVLISVFSKLASCPKFLLAEQLKKKCQAHTHNFFFPSFCRPDQGFESRIHIYVQFAFHAGNPKMD